MVVLQSAGVGPIISMSSQNGLNEGSHNKSLVLDGMHPFHSMGTYCIFLWYV